jgi:hypothetical protein
LAELKSIMERAFAATPSDSVPRKSIEILSKT